MHKHPHMQIYTYINILNNDDDCRMRKNREIYVRLYDGLFYYADVFTFIL